MTMTDRPINEYNVLYKDETIHIVIDQLDDLAKWSAHNDDKYSDLIKTIRESLDAMKG